MEGLLSTGPTPSSFILGYFNFWYKYDKFKLDPIFIKASSSLTDDEQQTAKLNHLI